MKIIGETISGFIVEMNKEEIARAAGYSSTYDDEWRKANSGNQSPRIGSEIDVKAAYRFHADISRRQNEAKGAAKMLRSLADILDGNLPEIVCPPEEGVDGR